MQEEGHLKSPFKDIRQATLEDAIRKFKREPPALMVYKGNVVRSDISC